MARAPAIIGEPATNHPPERPRGMALPRCGPVSDTAGRQVQVSADGNALSHASPALHLFAEPWDERPVMAKPDDLANAPVVSTDYVFGPAGGALLVRSHSGDTQRRDLARADGCARGGFL
jgi:hypothetical protein